jgi:Putative alpha-1,2-mannosidase
MTVKNNSSENKYIQRMTLNGKAYPKSYIQYKDIMNGGALVIEMGNKPSSWGVAPNERPHSEM